MVSAQLVSQIDALEMTGDMACVCGQLPDDIINCCALGDYAVDPSRGLHASTPSQLSVNIAVVNVTICG